MNTQNSFRSFLLPVATFALCASAVFAQSDWHGSAPEASETSATERMTVMDGAIGPCTILLTVTGPDGKPVYDANVKVHVMYGIAGIKKLDMEAGTNINGRVKFIGLPPRVHKAPLIFKATKEQLIGSVTYDPLQECDASKSIVLKKAEQ